MKKIATVLFCASLIFGIYNFASAQKIDFRLGPKVGLHLTTNSLKVEDQKIEMNARLGLHAGLITELDFGKFFAIQPGVLFSMNGFSTGENSNRLKGTACFVDIPINFIGKYDFGPTAIFVNVGPSFNFGLGGTIHKTYAPGIIYDYSYFDDQYGLKRFGLDLNMGIGVELNDAFQININYGLGLMNRSQESTSQWKQGTVMLSFSWLFQTKKK